MTDHLVIRRFILIFLQKLGSTGKSDLCDVLFHLISGHTDTVIDEFEGLLFGIDYHFDLGLIFRREGIVAHDLQLFKLGDGVAAVRDHLSDKNVMVGIEPFFDDRENIFTVDR